MFGKLGLEFRVNQQLFDGLKKSVCFLYGFPKKSTVKITDGMKKVKSVGAMNAIYPEEVSDFLLEKEHSGEDSLSDNDDRESYFEDDIDDDVEDVTDF